MIEGFSRKANIERLRDALKYLPSGYKIKFQCFNKQEVDEVKRQLHEEELLRVFFSWLDFS